MALAMVMAPGTELDILMVRVMAAALAMGEARVLNKNHKKNDGSYMKINYGGGTDDGAGDCSNSGHGAGIGSGSGFDFNPQISAYSGAGIGDGSGLSDGSGSGFGEGSGCGNGLGSGIGYGYGDGYGFGNSGQ
jgi:hypothetical protein